jgi:hypothetical protein
MSDSSRYTIGSEVRCSDGACGDLRGLAFDPGSLTLKHLVVVPHRRAHGGHFVRVDLVESGGETVQLRCTQAEFEALTSADETELPAAPVAARAQSEFVLTGMPPTDGGFVTRTVDALPPDGEVEIRPGDHVVAMDGAVGEIKGLLVDPASHRIEHVLLDDGHLLGRKHIAIPASSIRDAAAKIRLTITKEQVRELPPVE